MIALLVILCAGLSACGDSGIAAVKKTSIPQSDFTFGEALDDAKGCKSTEWTSRDDENGRPIVEYTCTAELSSKLIEIARKENTDKVTALTKRLEQGWQSAVESTKQYQSTLVQANEQARAHNDDQLNQINAQLQTAQERLSKAQAMTPEQYVGPVRNGYTPTLLADGERRKQEFLKEVQLQLDGVQRQKEATEKARNDPAEAGRQFSLAQYRTAAEYQATLDGMLAWKDRYYAAMSEAEAREMKKAEEYVSAAKGSKLQMKVIFIVKNKSPVELVTAKWVRDGKDDGTVNAAYLGAVLLDPKRMQEVLDNAQKARLSQQTNLIDFEKAFPIECDAKLVDGCELKKSSS